MPKAIEQETLQQMRDLCAKISVAHDLDESIREELLGHMEDKLLGYLSGEESLSEQDAFILVREHFGDPATVKALMQEAHPGPVRASLARRVGFAMITWSAVELFLHWAFLPFAWLFVENSSLESSWGVDVFSVNFFFAPVVIFWLLLLHWQRMISRGRKPWFLKARPGVFVCLSMVLVVLWIVPALGPFRYTPSRPVAQPTQWFMYIVPCIYLVLSCLPWLWWCDTPPRTFRSLVAAVAGWFMSSAFKTAGFFIAAYIAAYSSVVSLNNSSFQYKAQVAAKNLWQAHVTFPYAYPTLFCAAAAVGLYLLYRFSQDGTMGRLIVSWRKSRCVMR